MCCRKKQTKQHFPTTSYYIVPNEFTNQEDEPLVIRGQRSEIQSKAYKSIFEGAV